MTENAHTSGGFIGGRFARCPSCGELMCAGSPFCRFCGKAIDTAGTSPATAAGEPGSAEEESPTAIPVEQHPAALSAPPAERPAGLHFMPDGRAIPPEYPARFKPGAFSWPAFLFAELWHAEKGLIKRAMMHFWARLGTFIIGAAGMIMLVDAFGETDSAKWYGMFEGIVGILLTLAWLPAFFATAVFSHIDAQAAHRRYVDAFNASLASGDHARMKRSGLRAYWAILFVPFAVFILAFVARIMIG